MSSTYTAKQGQNLHAICIQVYGTTDLLRTLANDNNIEIDSEVTSGQVFSFNENLGNIRVVNKINSTNLTVSNNE